MQEKLVGIMAPSVILKHWPAKNRISERVIFFQDIVCNFCTMFTWLLECLTSVKTLYATSHRLLSNYSIELIRNSTLNYHQNSELIICINIYFQRNYLNRCLVESLFFPNGLMLSVHCKKIISVTQILIIQQWVCKCINFTLLLWITSRVQMTLFSTLSHTYLKFVYCSQLYFFNK